MHWIIKGPLLAAAAVLAALACCLAGLVGHNVKMDSSASPWIDLPGW